MDDVKVGGGIWSSSLLGSRCRVQCVQQLRCTEVYMETCAWVPGDLVNASCFNTTLIPMTQRRGSATQKCPNPQGP